jgi:lysophospholipase L1-like esterase
MWESAEADFAAYRVVNRGFGGSRMSDVLEYYDELILHYDPSAIFMYEGDNDIWDGRSPETVVSQFAEFLARTREELGDIPVVFVLPKPSGSRWNMRQEYDELAEGLNAMANADASVRILDTGRYFLSEDGLPDDSLFKEDRLHLNDAGYDIWRALFEPVLRDISQEQ